MKPIDDKPDPWLPIETAPKNGEVIDLWHEEYGRITDAWWDDCWTPTGTVDGYTHWMPQPNPPQHKKMSEDKNGD